MSHDEEEKEEDFKLSGTDSDESLDLPEEMTPIDDDDTDPENRFH